MADVCPRCGTDLPGHFQACPSCGLPRLPDIACPSCGAQVRKDDDYCWTCGGPLEHRLHCWHCGSAVWTYSAFCSSCGAPQPDLTHLLQRAAELERTRLPFPDRRQEARDGPPSPVPPPVRSVPPSAPPATPLPAPASTTPVPSRAPPSAPDSPAPEPDQLRIVTVLFADVSGFTKMSENLDPEQVKDIMNDCFAGLTEEITARGGVIDKYIGDCVMALFGVPVARENDAERALDAALGMQEFLKTFSRDLEVRAGLNLSMRVGINTGRVLAGLVGHGDSQKFTVMGDAVNLASRLEHACPVGSILVSNETYKLTKGTFKVRQLDPVLVKGKRDPVPIVEILGRRQGGLELAEPSFRGVRTRMIGRDREMNQMRSALAQVQQDSQPVVVSVRAPIGMGKSRLVFEFASWVLEEADCELDFLRCRDYRTESTYAPLIEQIDRLTGTEGHENPDVLWDRTRAYVDSLDLDEETHNRVEAAVANLVGVPPEKVPGLQAFVHDPEQLESAVREGILAFYRQRAAKRMVVLAVEDVHMASAPFLDLLTTMASLDDLPVLLVLSYRPEADTPMRQRFEYHDNRVHIELEGLNNVEAEEMVHNVLQKVEAVPRDLVQRVVQVTQGRPLFIEEILADMVERNIILLSDDHWDIDLARAREVSLPQSVEAAILSRVDSLPSASVEALQIASVVGDVCWEGLIADLGVPYVRVVLEDLVQRQFIRFRQKSQVPHEREFNFLLPAVREAVENHVLRKVKSRLHGSIANWLEARVDGEHEYFDRLLGHHHYEAGNTTKAIPYRLRAGQKAEERGDNGRALEDLQWIWDQTKGLGGALPIEAEDLAESRCSVVRLLKRLGQPADAVSAYNESVAILAALAADDQNVDLLLRRAALEAARASIEARERDVAAGLLREALEGLDADGDAGRLLAAALKKQQGWLAYLDKRYPLAMDLYREGISLIEDRGPSPELASLLDGLGVCLSRIGKWEEAELALVRALDTSKSGGFHESQAGTLGNMGALRYRQGNFSRALEHFRQAGKHYESMGDIVMAAVCRSNLGEVLNEEGRAAEARPELESALAVFQRTRSMDHMLSSLQILVDCLRKLGVRDSGKKRIQQLLSLAEQLDQQKVLRWALVQACGMAADEKNPEEIQSLLKRAQGVPGWSETEVRHLQEAVGSVPPGVLEQIDLILPSVQAG